MYFGKPLLNWNQDGWSSWWRWWWWRLFHTNTNTTITCNPNSHWAIKNYIIIPYFRDFFSVCSFLVDDLFFATDKSTWGPLTSLRCAKPQVPGRSQNGLSVREEHFARFVCLSATSRVVFIYLFHWRYYDVSYGSCCNLRPSLKSHVWGPQLVPSSIPDEDPPCFGENQPSDRFCKQTRWRICWMRLKGLEGYGYVAGL